MAKPNKSLADLRTRRARMAVDNSISTNAAAFAALRTLSKISNELTTAQNRVASGLRVSSALDDSAAFALAQGIRGELKAIAAVSQGLDKTKGVAKVALAGATGVSTLMICVNPTSMSSSS